MSGNTINTCQYVNQRGPKRGEKCGRHCESELCYKHKRPTNSAILNSDVGKSVHLIKKRLRSLEVALERLQEMNKELTKKVGKDSKYYKTLRKIQKLQIQ